MSNRRSFYTRAEERFRCEQLKLRLVEYVKEYFKQWRKPIPLKMLSAKYGRQLLYYGSTLRITIDELNSKGLISIHLNEQGSYRVTPGVHAWGTQSKRSG